ncbi:contractile injection system protein, VgrG/Pvc8 family [Paenibacillus sp. MMS18-CY102]|uniref:contractile injection system protein, VgrG/Pvc8 family n=1 Tax=Paenibacillus sp. MMS18-CY102 TaxID=2682849 RepID=UPI001365A81B|nr:contractile injection system protein, VgrG/Pvc8 family [Paenibacillus sp. MMS18-CY102]MWC30006.1 hypothetical protein [Paenibacillus sp. MMS18-CY102]
MDEMVLSYANLRITPYELVQIQSLKIVKSMNDHVRVSLTGIIPEKFKDQYVTKSESEEPVTIELLDKKSGRATPLFKGMVVDAEVRMVRGVYYLAVEAVSFTFLLDMKRKQRSFQNPRMTYSDLVKAVVDDYEKGDAIDQVSKGAAIGTFIMQYEETDWQFLKRMASRFNTVLVAVSAFDKPELFFGLSEHGVDKGVLQASSYTVKKRQADYCVAKDYQVPGVHAEDYLVYEVESTRVLDLAHVVTFQGHRLIVGDVAIELKDSILTCTYSLYPYRGLRQKKEHNAAIIGASIQARVLQVRKDTVQAKLDMDDQEEDSMDYWFPYSTIYASEDNTGWYCMPEVGDSIRIYFPSKKEERGIAISSVKRTVTEAPKASNGAGGGSANQSGGSSSHAGAGGGNSDRMSNPDTKSFRTKYGKEIVMGKDHISISAGNGLSITISDQSGISIESSKDVLIHSGSAMMLSSQNLQISAGKVELTGNKNSLLLEDKVEMKGAEIKMN